jgi:hypothetical protein
MRGESHRRWPVNGMCRRSTDMSARKARPHLGAEGPLRKTGEGTLRVPSRALESGIADHARSDFIGAN